MIQKLVLFIIKLFDFFHQKKIFKFLKKKGFDNIEILIDVGAHKGESIQLFLDNMNVAKIISFEASPVNFKFLREKESFFLNKYKDTKIIIENIALGRENKKESFKQFKESSSSTINSINLKSPYYKKKLKYLNFLKKEKLFEIFEIQITRLSDYLGDNAIKNIDFLKIDTEGYEYEVLLGLNKKILDTKIIMFEHHYDNMINKNYSFSDINKLLVKNKFKMIFKAKMPFRKTFE